MTVIRDQMTTKALEEDMQKKEGLIPAGGSANL